MVSRGQCYFIEKTWHAQQAGASALVVYDDRDEHLITMALPSVPIVEELLSKVTIPTVLIARGTGEKLKAAVVADERDPVVVSLDWRESVRHPDDRVEYALWTSTDPTCGAPCDAADRFVQGFGETAAQFEEQGYTQFTPHAALWSCPSWLPAEECKRYCARGGRYCPKGDPSKIREGGYEPREVVGNDLRLICAHRVLNETGRAYRWFEYAKKFSSRCRGSASTFNAECARTQMREVGLDATQVEACVGDLDLDAPLPLAEKELVEAAGEGQDADSAVLIFPTLVINKDQYRGYLSTQAVLRALCAGFKEGTEPAECLSNVVNVDECADHVDDCWRAPQGDASRSPHANVSACVDTFRGYECVCPVGWEGDGKTCTDVDECAKGTHNCDQKCTNIPGSFVCACASGYRLVGGNGDRTPGVCIREGGGVRGSGLAALLVGFSLAIAATSFGGIVIYRWKTKGQMENEIRAIMRDYMPLADERGAGAAGAGAGANGTQGAGASGLAAARGLFSKFANGAAQSNAPTSIGLAAAGAPLSARDHAAEAEEASGLFQRDDDAEAGQPGGRNIGPL